MSESVELRPTIDRAWLEAASERAPVEHAYALWDLDQFPDRIRMVCAIRHGSTVGYLLIWLGLPNAAVVHWHGVGPGSERLADVLPSRPLVVIVPSEARSLVLAARGEGVEYPERMMFRAAGLAGSVPLDRGEVRLLLSSDAPELWAWALRHPDPLVNEYPGLDPGTDAVWGAFEAGRLVGAARAAVRLPREWIVAGVFVEPEARRRGYGEGMVAAIAAAASHHGAGTGLYVREDRPDAGRLYERLGFRTLGRRVWLDLGAGVAP
ncbi:MAG: GNAT family N-acetyltransferase [Thermoplasmata archaeon]